LPTWQLTGWSVDQRWWLLQFLDYTKSATRYWHWLTRREEWDTNYHMTFSWSGENEEHCREFLAAGGTVAVPFHGKDIPAEFLGRRVID
jgi:hypothetical protein